MNVTACRPVLPVNALALPELTTSARARPLLSLARHHSTGADGHFERVSTPATLVPLSNSANSTSVRPWYLMPAAPVARRTPATSGMSGTCLGASGETRDMAVDPGVKTQMPGATAGHCDTIYIRRAGDQFYFFCSAGGAAGAAAGGVRRSILASWRSLVIISTCERRTT